MKVDGPLVIYINLLFTKRVEQAFVTFVMTVQMTALIHIYLHTRM